MPHTALDVLTRHQSEHGGDGDVVGLGWAPSEMLDEIRKGGGAGSVYDERTVRQA